MTDTILDVRDLRVDFPGLRAVDGASFAVPAGLLVYPQYAHLEHVEPRHVRQLKTGTNGYFGRVGRWLREGF